MVSASDLVVEKASKDEVVFELNLKREKATNSQITIQVVVCRDPQLMGANLKLLKEHPQYKR